MSSLASTVHFAGKFNNIYEYVSNAGVTVDGILLKDGLVDGRDVSVDGINQDNHIASTTNPHSVTIDQVTPTTTKGDLLVENGSNVVRLAVGANGTILKANSVTSTGLEWSSFSSLTTTTCIKDVKTIGTNGGTFTSGTWQTRTLNTLLDSNGGTESVPSSGGITLASNTFTCQAGTYFIHAIAPSYRVNSNQTRLRNTTDATTLAVGQSTFSGGFIGYSSGECHLMHIFTIASAKQFQIQHQCDATRAADGFGLASGFGPEVYTAVYIVKLS